MPPQDTETESEMVDMVETDIEAEEEAFNAPSVSLNFGGGGKAWDDRELIRAYDAAMEDFHVSRVSLWLCEMGRGEMNGKHRD